MASGTGWSWNIGYHNPPGSNFGLNFQYFWTNWAVELGVGSINSSNNNNNNNSSAVSVGGDVNLKYLFGSSTFRPYLEGGVGMGTAAASGSNGGVSAGTGSGFLGLGLMLKGNPFYFYIGAVSGNNSSGDLNLGLGFDF